MAIILTVALVVASVVAIVNAGLDKSKNRYGLSDDAYWTMDRVCEKTFETALLVGVICLLIVFIFHLSASIDLMDAQAMYDSLIYQCESGMYNDDFAKKLLFDEVQDWNRRIVVRQNVNDGFFDLLIIDKWAELPLIDYSIIK